tara:strand:- start:2357 stop:2818 length:462 start_codon:yes stop_codon:yes gene_type:complete
MKKSILLILFFGFILKSEAQEITMFTVFFDYQYYQDDTRITKKKLANLIETNQEAIRHWNRSKTFSNLSLVALTSEIGFLVWEVSDNKPYENESNNMVTQIGVFGSFAAVLTFGFLSISQKKKTILKYNQGLDKKTTFEVQPSKNGIGIAMVF